MQTDPPASSSEPIEGTITFANPYAERTLPYNASTAEIRTALDEIEAARQNAQGGPA